MDNGIVIVNGNGGDIFRGGREGSDVREELISPDLHSVIKEGVVLPIVQDSSAEGRSPFHLLRVPEVSCETSQLPVTSRD